jgi:hypothetical protein
MNLACPYTAVHLAKLIERGDGDQAAAALRYAANERCSAEHRECMDFPTRTAAAITDDLGADLAAVTRDLDDLAQIVAVEIATEVALIAHALRSLKTVLARASRLQ